MWICSPSQHHSHKQRGKSLTLVEHRIHEPHRTLASSCTLFIDEIDGRREDWRRETRAEDLEFCQVDVAQQEGTVRWTRTYISLLHLFNRSSLQLTSDIRPCSTGTIVHTTVDTNVGRVVVHNVVRKIGYIVCQVIFDSRCLISCSRKVV